MGGLKLWPLKREIENRLYELYSQGLNDKQIAQVTGLNISAVWKWRKAWSLPGNVRPVSICWDCQNAYPLKCFKFPFRERHWVKKYVKWAGGWVVLECERFVRDEEGEDGQKVV